MGGYRVPTAVDERSSTSHSISVPCHGPRDSWKSTRAMDTGSSTLLTFLCETSMCPTSLQTCDEKPEPELTLWKRQGLNFLSIFYLNKNCKESVYVLDNSPEISALAISCWFSRFCSHRESNGSLLISTVQPWGYIYTAQERVHIYVKMYMCVYIDINLHIYMLGAYYTHKG